MISYLTIIKLGGVIIKLNQETPNNKDAKNSVYAAVRVMQTIKDEANPREGLNRALTHLESAFENYTPRTWDVWDKEKVLWDKKTFKNSICLIIAALHYALDNKSIARKWLVDNLDEWGSIYFPQEILEAFSMTDENEFYESIGCLNAIKTIKSDSDSNWHYLYEQNDIDDYFVYRNSHYD